ncbi:MAG TPA: DUF349 domain-containing protein, partial [Bacteroidales bacterium]
MDTKETNNLPTNAELEDTLTEAVNSTADNQPEVKTEIPKIVKTKTKRVTKPKATSEPIKTKEETILVQVEEVAEPASETIDKPETAVEVETPVEAETPIHTISSKQEIIDLLKSLIENSNTDIKEKVDILKQSFYKIHKQEVENARKVFVEAGNAIESFVAEEDAKEADFKVLLNDWREKRAERQAEQEKQRKTNLEKKTQIIEDIKALTDSTEDIGRNLPEFRKLLQTWKEIGS